MPQRLIRIFTTLLTALVTLGLLIGGAYIYEKMFYTAPLEAAVNKLPAVGSFKIVQSPARARISVEFKGQEKLRNNFYLLLDELEGQSGQAPENLTVEICNNSEETLGSFLKEAKLALYEAVSTGVFTGMPGELNELSASYGVDYNLEMDDSYIFLTATQGERAAHFIINRTDKGLNVINTMGGEYI